MAIAGQQHTWMWRGQQIAYRCIPPQPTQANSEANADTAVKQAVLCIHGFGACKEHWRHNIGPLAAGQWVYAIDLLGFGASSKPLSCLADEPLLPGGVRYGFDLWAEQVVAFCREVIGAGSLETCLLQLIGNSIGGIVALNAARLLSQQQAAPRQVILIDCAERELDLKRLPEQPWPAQLSRPLVMALVRQRWLISSLFRLLARPAVVRQVLSQAYPSGGNVDAELEQLLLQPSRDPGAPESFRGFVNLFNDWLAPQLLAQLHLPVRMLWGGADPWEPVAEAERWQRNFACVQELRVLEGLGHCPHDEDPEQVNPILLAWLQQGWDQLPKPASNAG